MDDYVDVVFDGPPGPTPGRFVEVENSNGESLHYGEFGEWHRRLDGYWVLRVPQAGGASKRGLGDIRSLIKNVLLTTAAVLSFAVAYGIVVGLPETFGGTFKLIMVSFLVSLGIEFSCRLARRKW